MDPCVQVRRRHRHHHYIFETHAHKIRRIETLFPYSAFGRYSRTFVSSRVHTDTFLIRRVRKRLTISSVDAF